MDIISCIAPALQANVRNYFMQFEEAQTQSLIDSKIMEFEMKSRQGLQVNSDHKPIFGSRDTHSATSLTAWHLRACSQYS